MGPYWGRLGAIFGPLGALLGLSWGRIGASWGLSWTISGDLKTKRSSCEKHTKTKGFSTFLGPPGLPSWAKMGQVGPQDRPSWGQDRVLRRLGSSCRDDVEKMSSSSRLEVVLRRVKSHKVEFANPPPARMASGRSGTCLAKGVREGGGEGRAFPQRKLAHFVSWDDIKSHTFVGRFRSLREGGPRRGIEKAASREAPESKARSSLEYCRIT